MADYGKGILDLIGNTPLIEVKNIEKELGLGATVLVKLEYLNPAGSTKDRVAKAMIEDAEARGILREGAVIIEPTSGNTGIGLASIAAVKGYRERRAEEYSESIRSRAGPDRRRPGNGGRDQEGRRAGRGDPGQFHSGAVCQSRQSGSPPCNDGA